MATARTTDRAYTLHVRLAEIEPPIWRRLTVPGNLTLFQLHQVLQVAMGWYHSHLHQFLITNKDGTIAYYGEPDPEDDYRLEDERHVRLAQIAPKKGVTFLYTYDFGDNWTHEIIVERIEPTTKDNPAYRWLLDGARACPPEDVGGTKGLSALPRSLA